MFIPYGKHCIEDDDIEAVSKALKRNYIATGPGIAEFEDAFAKYVGAKYAVALSSGTAALHACCFAIDIKQGDEVITTPLTFAASANCVLYCGGTPVFADVDSDTYNISPEEIEKRITDKTRAIIPVHFTGQPCDMDRINAIAKKYNLFVIEDAAHATGAEYHGRKIGSISDMTIFSFHPVKHMTTCEGGMVTTDNEELYKKIKAFRAYCITKDPELLEDKEDGPWHYEMQGLGYNYRISDVMCALGISQLKKIDSFVKRRREIAKRYNEEMKDFEHIILPYQAEGCNSSWHLYTILIKDGKRREAYRELKEAGIGVDVHYLPVYRHPYYQRHGYQDIICPNAEAIYDQILSIPIFYKLTDEEQAYVIKQILNLAI
ncbi:MAG: UDP-4-amino-4,6-dideoxy-N-acetyl-beta-L-altrosamine transaminase [Lachnospiraceae bacterium]|nr:UDP-4-amino-4,6-dideoxy-N-acetyl-beta-L-altrosamine transaminase [Lachnospiraceae bacterium]